jgi:hypothetical protein
MDVKQTTENRIGKGQPGPGRPKGIPNKTTTAIKEMVIEALSKAGGVDYLHGQAATNPTAFLTLVGKVLPLQVNGAGADGEHLHKVTGALAWKSPQ